jgi:hypothetical protein
VYDEDEDEDEDVAPLAADAACATASGVTVWELVDAPAGGVSGLPPSTA